MTPTENPDDKLDNLENIGVGPVDFGSFDTGSFSLDTAKERVNKLVKPVRDFINRADAEPTDFTGIEKSYGDILDHRTDARVKEKAKQAELDAKYEQLTDYYRVDDGTPFDAQQEELLKQGIPKWMQQRALYEAQESYGEALELEGSPVNARTKSVLDHNLLEAGDSPFEAYESHLNREEHVNAADRRLNTILPQFSGVEGLSDDEAKIYAVVNLIAENEDVHPDHIYDNLGAYTQQYATMMGVKAVTAMDLHAPMKKGLDTEKTYFDNDTANYKAGMQAAINGTSLKEGVTGVTLDDREDSHSRGIFTAGHAAAVDKYGDKLSLGAKMFELYSDDRTMLTKAVENAGFDNSLAGYAKMLANPSQHSITAVKLALGTNQKRDAEQYAMAEFLASMPREEAKTAMEAAMLIAEANSGEMDDDFVTKFSESLMRGTSKYLYSLEDAITTTSERMGFYSDEEVGQRARVRETLQDLGDIKDIHSAIVSDYKVIQGAYDMAQSAPYMMAYATGAGTTLNALAMLSETDKELRQKYPEMSRTARYKVALPTAVVNANIETLQFKSWTRGFTSFSKGLGKMSPLGVARLAAGRGVAQLVTENLEESAQSASRVWIQHAWSLLGEDVSEVTPEDWDESLFIYDERTFFATLPLAVLGAGGRTAYDTIGAKQNEVLLSDVDRMRLFGLSKEKAEAIADQPDAMKKWLMFKDTKETFSVDERNAAIEDAMEDGVLERVLKADDEASFAEYEKDIMENGTDNQKAGVVVERTEREYREKFDAQMSEDGEGFKVTYPSVAGKPTAKFKTVEEAEQAIQEHQVETNEEFLETIGSAAKNLEAMDLHKQSLEVLHKGAEIKLGEDTITMEEFASQSEENMAQALERIEHELYRMGVPRAATTADLKNWKANGQVHLKREMRGYIAKLGKGANIADLVEEGSEGFVRDLIQNGMVSSKWLKDQIFQFQLDSGKTLTPAKSAVEMTDQQMVEAFSDLAVGNFWNAHSASKTGPMGGIINALRVFFAKVMELADQLAKLSKEGKVDADFQTLLDNSVGLNMDQQIEDNVPKFQQEIVDENDTFSLQQVNKTSANDMADALGVDRTIPAEYIGKKFLPIMADHLGIGDADGVPMQGGAGHPLLYHGTGVGWRSKRGAIAGIYGYLKKRDAIWTDEDGHEWALVAPFGMSQDAHKSNKSVFFAYIKSLENTNMSKADKLALGEYIRERADKEVNGTKKKKLNVSRMLSFPLDWTKAQLDELTHDFSHDERAYLMDGLKLAGAKHLNIPDVQTVINQLRDDSYDKVNNGSMLSLLKVDVTRLREGLKKGTENGLDASDFGVEEHLSYDTVLPADIVTHLRQPIDMEVAFPDMIKTMREVSPKSAPSYLLQAKLPAAVELQTLTPELVEEINNEQAGEATPVAKAKAYINALSDKWNVIQTGKLKGAANFIAAMERNEFSETLTPINMESLKADVKSGDLSVYGLEGFDVWFGLRKREDGGKELVNVISNELSTGGMVDLIMMKAIKEGATHLDAYSVKSKKFPNGLLPTLYGRYGFKATSEDAYDKNYLGSTAKARNTKEAALKELWAKQGWDSSGQEMPSLVYMRYEPTPATEQLRQNAQDSMVERSIEELRGETIQPSEGDGDVSGSRVDGGKSGGDVGGDRGALSRRANSFLDELGSASSARLAAWNLTESERDQLVAGTQQRTADETSFSLTSSEDSIIDKLNAMMRDQDTRIEVYRNMSARLNKVRQRIHTNKHSSDFVTQNLAEMEAIVSVLPPELRHRAFSAKTLASKKTGEGASRYMVERLEYIDKILERFLKGEITESVVKAINQSQPLPRGGGDRGPSKIGALGHRVAAAAKEAIFMSPMEAEAASKLVLESLNKKVEPTVEEEQMVHDVAYVYEVFADIKNADSTRLSTMLDLMQTNWEEGRSKWLGELKKRKEWKEGKVASILKGLDMVEKDDAATTKALQKGLNPIKQFGRSLLSFYQLTDVLREDMGKEGKVIKEMLDDLRRAQSNFDMEQLHHKERMRAQFARIFGIKGTNKVARVQARLNSIAKGVDRGDKLTTSKMYDFNVKVWGADLDKAKAQLQVTPDAKEIVVGGIPLTRDEFDEVYEAYTLDIEAGFFDANKKNRKYSALVQRQTGERWNVGEKSQLDLANDFLAMQQADLKGKYQKTGHDEQYERELNEALDDDVKELAMWMQNELRILTPQTEKLHTEEYGLFMATVENYFPASFEHASKSGDTALTMDGIDVAGVSTRPSSHKMRINHHSRPVRTNAVNAFNHHIMQNAYWKTHAEVLRKWGGVMRNKDVQDGILRAKGKGFLDQLLNQFEDVETQGSKVAASQIAADRLWRGLTKGVALGVLGGRMTTVAKNMAATFNVALGEDIGTLLKGVDPTEFKEATKELWYSDTFQRRLKMGANVATRYALEGSRSGAIIPATATRMAEMSMQLINVADTGSNMAMSLAYIAKKKELRQQNKYKEEEIKLIALDHVDDLMERYAQPTNRLSKSLMENTRHPMAQILVMFQSESRKMMAINALAIRKLATGKGAQSKGLAAQQLAVQVVLMTGFIHTISAAYDAFIKGEGEGEEEGEKFFANFTDWKRLLATMAADSLSGVPLFGELWSTSWKSIFDQKTFVSSNNPAMKPILGLQAFIKGAEQAGENSASETADKFFRSLQAMGGIMPQTAVVAQASTLAKDALGFMNNTLATGLTKADTFDVYRKKIKGVISRTGKEFEEDMEAAETLGEKRILDAERKQLILERSRVILFNIPEDERQEFLLEQAGSEKSGVIPKYIIRSYLK